MYTVFKMRWIKKGGNMMPDYNAPKIKLVVVNTKADAHTYCIQWNNKNKSNMRAGYKKGAL